MGNSRKQRNTSSQYKGVSWSKQRGNWLVRIMINGRSTHIGYYDIEQEAARAYDEAASKAFGEFACLNFKLS